MLHEKGVLRPIAVADAQVAHSILQASAEEAGCPSPPQAAISNTLERLSSVLTLDSRLLWIDGRPAAVALLFLPPLSGDPSVISLVFDVHPSFREAEAIERLATWIDGRVREAKREHPEIEKLRSSCDLRNHARSRGIEALGFSPERYSFRMQATLDVSDASPELSSGLRLSVWDDQQSSSALDVFNKAFLGHWGLPVLDEETWRSRFIDVSQFRAKASVLALHEDEVVGLCINWLPPEKNPGEGETGWIEAIGVLPSHRGQGIADAMMIQSLNAFAEQGLSRVELDVDTQNETGALGLYEKHGFRPIQQTVLLEKRTGA